MNKLIIAFSFLMLSCNNQSEQHFSINRLFSDNMVIQHNAEPIIWGKALTGSSVRLISSWGQTASTQTDKDGKWSITLKTPKTDQKTHKLTVINNNHSLEIKNILLGEVWLASGQSNMEMPIKGFNYAKISEIVEGANEEIPKAIFPKIRMFTVKRNIAYQPDQKLEGDWIVCSPKTVGDFSAVGYFFAKKLHQELNTPIGIIHSSWGGSPAESWTRLDYLEKISGFNDTEAKLKIALDPNTTYNKWLKNRRFVHWDSIIEVENFKWISNDNKKFSSVDFDDENWNKIHSNDINNVFEENDFNGIVWLRNKIIFDTIPEANLTLDLGDIDDLYAVFINGEMIGRKEYWGISSNKFSVPKNILKEGINNIAIRFIDVWGKGGPVENEKSGFFKQNKKVKSLGNWWKINVVAFLTNGHFYLLSDEKDEIVFPNPERMPHHPNSPTVLFNGMIAPLVPFSIKGVIWYQGESNESRADQYQTLFPAVIDSWRDEWKNQNMPFYYVQIAPFGGGFWGNDEISKVSGAELRESQMLTLFKNDVGMAIITDIGNEKLIHPPKKKEVGERLALWSLAKNYGYDDLVHCGPVFKSVEYNDSKAFVSFNHIGSGLYCPDQNIKYFELAGVDGHYYPAKAKIVNNKVVVWTEKVTNPQKVRFAWKNYVKVNLFNNEGLPASSFRSKR